MQNLLAYSRFHIFGMSLLLSYILHGETYECDEGAFYRPYVLVKRRRSGGNIAEIRSTGFLDLRFKNGIVLCINGPAVMYSDVEKIEPEARLNPTSDASKSSLSSVPDARFPSPEHGMSDFDSKEEEIIFKKWEMRVFSHECISANRVPTNVLKKMKADQGRRYPEIMPDTPVTGKLVLGIYLIGDKEGFNRPVLAWFRGREFEYIKSKDRTVKDSSFILSYPTAQYCLHLPDGTRATVFHQRSPEDSPNVVCQWAAVDERIKPRYAKMFQRGFDSNGVRNGEPTFQDSDYEVNPCPDLDDAERKIILDMGKTTPEPVTHSNYTEFDPFSMINPNLWTPHGYRKDSMGLSGGDEHPEDKGQLSGGAPQEGTGTNPCGAYPTDPQCTEIDDIEATTQMDMQNVEPSNAFDFLPMSVTNCKPLPVYLKENCTQSRNGNRLLEIVLELVPQFVPAEPIKTGVEPTEAQRQESHKYLNLNDNATLAWKWDLLYQVAEIFSQLCMPFRQEMPYTIARVMAWYLMKAHLFGKGMGRNDGPHDDDEYEMPDLKNQFDPMAEKADPWPILIKELDRCSEVAKSENGGRGLQFQWEIGEDETGKWKIPAIDGRETRRRRKRNADGVTHKRQIRKRDGQHNERSTRNDKDTIAVDDIDANTGEKILSRRKRDRGYRINGSAISTKYVLPGKSLTAVYSEGTFGYAREAIQEYKMKPNANDPRADSSKYWELPHNVHHCWHPREDPVTRQITCSRTEELFYYEDHLEVIHELNIAIDLWWKIWATVIGYCTKASHSRKSETFPRMYSTGTDYFFKLVEFEWLIQADNPDLKIIFSEYLTEESQVWLDSCLEAAYVNSNSQSFRPPRPTVCIHMDPAEEEIKANYFESLPPHIYHRYHPDPSVFL